MTSVRKLPAVHSAQELAAGQATAAQHAIEQAITDETITSSSHQPADGCSQKFVRHATDLTLHKT